MSVKRFLCDFKEFKLIKNKNKNKIPLLAETNDVKTGLPFPWIKHVTVAGSSHSSMPCPFRWLSNPFSRHLLNPTKPTCVLY